jgi:dihydropteroate synthase
MHDIGVDPYGARIMLPKALNYLVKVDGISPIAANILKQEMLSFGGDAAVARDVLTGRAKKTDCLLIGNLAQLNRLKDKLHKQPFGLPALSRELTSVLGNYQKNEFIMKLGKFGLAFRKRCLIMGIVNVTPDSFSGDGLYKLTVPEIVNYALKLERDGADIIDIGGESSRPGAKPVPVKEEIKRIIPALKEIVKKIKIPVSVDTYKPEVAKQALDNGAAVINDITGLRDARMTKIISKYKAGAVIMHMKGNPRTMQNNPEYGSVTSEIIDYFKSAISRAEAGGICKDKIIIDPGIGFGKSYGHNLEILNGLAEFKVLGRPILAGTSRKSFLGKILNTGPDERIFGTISSCVLAAGAGANMVRVHDVKQVYEALKVSNAILNS